MPVPPVWWQWLLIFTTRHPFVIKHPFWRCLVVTCHHSHRPLIFLGIRKDTPFFISTSRLIVFSREHPSGGLTFYFGGNLWMTVVTGGDREAWGCLAVKGFIFTGVTSNAPRDAWLMETLWKVRKCRSVLMTFPVQCRCLFALDFQTLVWNGFTLLLASMAFLFLARKVCDYHRVWCSKALRACYWRGAIISATLKTSLRTEGKFPPLPWKSSTAATLLDIPCAFGLNPRVLSNPSATTKESTAGHMCHSATWETVIARSEINQVSPVYICSDVKARIWKCPIDVKRVPKRALKSQWRHQKISPILRP